MKSPLCAFLLLSLLCAWPASAAEIPDPQALPAWEAADEPWGSWSELRFKDAQGAARSLWCRYNECTAKTGTAKLYTFNRVKQEPFGQNAWRTTFQSELSDFTLDLAQTKVQDPRQPEKLPFSYGAQLTAAGSVLRVLPPQKRAQDAMPLTRQPAHARSKIDQPGKALDAPGSAMSMLKNLSKQADPRLVESGSQDAAKPSQPGQQQPQRQKMRKDLDLSIPGAGQRPLGEEPGLRSSSVLTKAMEDTAQSIMNPLVLATFGLSPASSFLRMTPGAGATIRTAGPLMGGFYSEQIRRMQPARHDFGSVSAAAFEGVAESMLNPLTFATFGLGGAASSLRDFHGAGAFISVEKRKTGPEEKKPSP